MSNLGFELWWAGDITTLLTIQPQVGSPEVGTGSGTLSSPTFGSFFDNG
jgi:hypothetical protein